MIKVNVVEFVEDADGCKFHWKKGDRTFVVRCNSYTFGYDPVRVYNFQKHNWLECVRHYVQSFKPRKPFIDNYIKDIYQFYVGNKHELNKIVNTPELYKNYLKYAV